MLGFPLFREGGEMGESGIHMLASRGKTVYDFGVRTMRG